MKNLKSSGFTLIELLIVIGVIAILAAFAFVALNPLARFADSRNAKRWTDVNAILSAIKLDQVDNGGTLIGDVDELDAESYYQIGSGGSSGCNATCEGVALQEACVDLAQLVDDGYLPSVPIDPGDPNAETDYTRYYLVKHANGTITIGACSEETGSAAVTPEISVSR